MEDLFTFFRNLFPVFWDFFNIEFPLLGMTIFEVGIACIFISIGFRVVRWLLFDSASGVPRMRDIDSIRGQDKE